MLRNRVLIAVLLLAALAKGMDPRLVKEMNLSFVQQGYVKAVGGELNYLNLNLSVPDQTDYQNTVTDRPVVRLDDGNMITNFESSHPANPFDYTISSSTTLEARQTTSLPNDYELTPSEMRYLEATGRVESNDSAITELAREITANSSDDFERISKLAVWVNTQLTYDPQLAGSLKDAKWILQNKRGVCTEYATLFITMSRSIGIPARFVNGLAYDEDSGQWVGHSWAEAYIGKWVPVDPTWSPPEIGYLDAAHLEFEKLLDNETFDNVYAVTSQNAYLNWSNSKWSTPDSQGVSGVTISGLSEAGKNANYDLEEVAGNIGFGARTVVFAVISSDDYRVVTLNLSACDALQVEDGERYIIMRPGERKVVSWIVDASPLLSANYVYTCEVVVDSDYLSPKNATIQLASDNPSINFNAFLEKPEIGLGENQTVYVDIGVARKYGGKVYLTSEGYSSSQTISRSGRYAFSLQPDKVGLNKLYVATSFGGVQELQFNVRGHGMSAELNIPQFIQLGNETRFYLNLTSNESGRVVRITANAGSYKHFRQITLAGNESVEFSFNVTDPTLQNITVLVESEGFQIELTKPVTPYEIPVVSLANVSFAVEGGSVRAYLVFSGLENALNATLSVDNNSVSLLGNQNASLLLTPGGHSVRLTYADASGMQYQYSQRVDVPSASKIKGESGLDAYIKEVTAFLPVILYFGLVVILLAAVLILKKTEKRTRQQQ